MKVISFSLEQNNKYFGAVDGSKFYIGNRVSYKGTKGLVNLGGGEANKYNPDSYRSVHGFWADFIYPTACAEGASYNTLNTYDRARFTFSFLQFAAHVPDGDFVQFFRALIRLPLANDYFPDLLLNHGRIARVTDKGIVDLESATSTDSLLDYLNPSSSEIEDTEIIQAAKFVHWAQSDAANRRAQVNVGINSFKLNMHIYAKQYKLDKAFDYICVVIADILHQGRAKSSDIILALSNQSPLDALLQIGEHLYPSRIKILRTEIQNLIQRGTLGKYKYDISQNDFIEA